MRGSIANLDPHGDRAAGALDLRDLLSFRLARLAAANDRLGQMILQSQFGLRLHEWRVLGIVGARDGIHFRALAESLMMDKSQLSRLVKTLSGRDLLTSRPDPSDQRTTKLSLTGPGRALYFTVLQHVSGDHELAASALTRDEAETMFALVDKLETYVARRSADVTRMLAGGDSRRRQTKRPRQQEENP